MTLPNLSLDIKQSTQQTETKTSGGYNGVNINYAPPLAGAGTDSGGLISKTLLVTVGAVAAVCVGLYLLLRRH